MMIILQALCSTLLQFSVCVLVWNRLTCVMIFLFDSLWNLCLAKDCYRKWPEMLSWLSPCNASGGIFCLKIGCQGTIGTTSFGQEEEAKAGRSVRPRSQEMQKSETNLEVVRDPGVSLRFLFCSILSHYMLWNDYCLPRNLVFSTGNASTCWRFHSLRTFSILQTMLGSG